MHQARPVVRGKNLNKMDQGAERMGGVDGGVGARGQHGLCGVSRLGQDGEGRAGLTVIRHTLGTSNW